MEKYAHLLTFVSKAFTEMIISGDVSKEDLTAINELLAVEVGQLLGHHKI